ncbi:hypothetical protein NA57DRAFT_60826 [Rhizodiscina lignyota]|uniref:Trichothecene 3-O-acetyltransferase n=1 Tax=Rhizodiscina lignyota TaxID=1504668 RepID=A0A9P4I6Q8_9PEZI|nr:hypothetical protein NA57DRAFT_60826 [Rhizodiscina lignyota]
MDVSAAPSLTILERGGVKVFLRFLLPFSLPPDHDKGEVISILRSSFEATAARIPLIACDAVPDLSAPQRESYKLVKSSLRDFEVQDLSQPGQYHMSYDELKQRRFPCSAFDAKTFCIDNTWCPPGTSFPMVLARITFIPGGLIMSWSCQHIIGDASSWSKVLEIWAEECRKAQGLPTNNPAELPDTLFEGRERFMAPHNPDGLLKGKIEDHPEWTLFDFTPTELPPAVLDPNHSAEVFHFSKSALQELKRNADPTNAQLPHEDVTWISTNDALSALLWRTVISCQFPLSSLAVDEDFDTHFTLALNGRSRVDPPLHPDTFGSYSSYAMASMSIRRLLTCPLADVAIVIRRSHQTLTKTFYDDTMVMFNNLPDLGRIQPTAHLDMPGKRVTESSWSGVKVYELDWGNKLGRIDALRVPDIGLANGLQIALPPLPAEMGGGLEVVVGLMDDCKHRLNDEREWNMYAKGW